MDEVDYEMVCTILTIFVSKEFKNYLNKCKRELVMIISK